MSRLALVLLVIALPALAANAPLTLDALRAQRREAAHRPRGIIANNDGCDVLYFPGGKPVTVENFLAERTTALADSQVATIAYCTISSGFSNFTHGTKIGTVLTRQGPEFGLVPGSRNITRDLIDLGSDCLASVVSFGHEHGKEVFWSMRMNDTHDAEWRPDKPYLLYPPLKEQHPDWLVGDPVKRTPKGRWSSVDYARPEIRDLAFRYVEEVCRGYDVDGVELDFFRHLCYFRSTAMGGKATDEEREAMTGLLRRVREMTEQVGLARGRPILVAVRTPDSAGFCRDLGLDLERWLADGLVDLLVTTCYFQLNPWETSVELGHRYDVPVYPCLSDSRVRGETRFRRASIESYRGRAANAWAAGADGIHLFNTFNPRGAVFRELGDPAKLAGMDKLFFVTVRDGDPGSWLAGGAEHQTVALLTPSHAASIGPEQPLVTEVRVGDDLAAAQAAGLQPTVTLHLEVPRATRPEELAVSLNGHLLSGGTLAKGWLDLPVDPARVVRGANQLQVALNAAEKLPPGAWSASWTGAALPGSPWDRDPGSARTEATLADGALRIADRGTEGGDYLYYRYPWGAPAGGNAVVEAEVKVVADSSYLLLGNGVGHERLGLWPDRIELWSKTSLRYAMDTTDEFHTYRIEIQGPDLRVLVDGVPRIEAPGTFVGRGTRYGNEVGFGAANSPMVGDAIWRSVRLRVDSQSVRDAVVSVKYARP